jgi:signal transduction histidine kinase
VEYGTDKGDIIIYDPTILRNQNIILGKERNYAKLYFRHGEDRYLENIDFNYLIEGIHENWQSARSEDFIQLVDLRPGNYRLKVRMIYDGSIIESSLQVFNLQVREYFYKTIWFYLLMAVLVILLVVFYLRALLVRERKIRELRTMLSRNLHDEVGSYLTGISMNVDMIRKKTSGISEYQQSISDLSRKALAALKDGLWSLDRESDTGQHFWDRVKVIAKESFEPLEIDYSINAPKDLSRIRLGIIQKNQLIYVIKECFTNAMKYGKGNAVSISWDLLEGKHRIVIRNRKADDVIKSGGMQGIDNIRYRMSELGGAAVLEDTAQEFSVILYLYFIK